MREQAGALRKRASNRVNRGAFQGLIERERRQDCAQAPRHHRFARAGRARQQQVVPASRRDFQCAAREELPPDIGEIPVLD